jgi:nitrogen fixation protein FixH/multisubunit Na+/H+ antiporter MnhB subunit
MTTLFGGLTAVLALYAIGGLFRTLPAMLRALLAGVIPLITYFVLIMGRWPGLDVVAIHISVFLAAALVLFAMSQFRRRGAERMHWAPKLLISFFVGLVFLNAALLYLSTKGLPDPIARWWLGRDDHVVYTGFSGVVSHGQNAAKAVSSELSETHRESLLGWQVDVSGLDGSGLTRLVEVRVKDRTGLPVDRVEAELRLMRPGAHAAALTLPLSEAEAGVYMGSLALPASGRWLLDVQLKRDGGRQYHSIQEVNAP